MPLKNPVELSPEEKKEWSRNLLISLRKLAPSFGMEVDNVQFYFLKERAGEMTVRFSFDSGCPQVNVIIGPFRKSVVLVEYQMNNKADPQNLKNFLPISEWAPMRLPLEKGILKVLGRLDRTYQRKNVAPRIRIPPTRPR